ncbi:hypothetical protein M758_UG183600 [Ceratodon purpureus]|nr:hypothetical protein M758_UG183600 [Ceratodon purpureus]
MTSPLYSLNIPTRSHCFGRSRARDTFRGLVLPHTELLSYFLQVSSSAIVVFVMHDGSCDSFFQVFIILLYSGICVCVKFTNQLYTSVICESSIDIRFNSPLVRLSWVL